jgi:hypothetical protein
MPIPSPSSTLVKAIESKSAVLIVGSGLSIPAGAPTWSALLEGIAAEAWETTPHDTQKVAVALAENDAGRPSSAAAILKGVLGAEFENVIARQFEERKTVTRNVAGIAAARAGDATATLFSVVRPAKRTLRPTATHKTLMKLPWRAVITTNYDRLLEGAAPHLPSLSWSSDSVSALVQRRDPFVFKLHGDVVHRGDIVLARDDYKRVVNHPRVKSDLHALLAGGTAFWVGYGHNDADLDLTLDELVEVTGGSGGFTVAKHADRIALEPRFKASRVSAVWLDGFDDLPAFIDTLARAAGVAPAPRKAAVRATPAAPKSTPRPTTAARVSSARKSAATPPAAPIAPTKASVPPRWTITHAAVREFVALLAGLYDTASVARVCHDAGIATHTFDTRGAGVNVWERAVTQALNTARLDALVAVVIADGYSGNPEEKRLARVLRASPV